MAPTPTMPAPSQIPCHPDSAPATPAPMMPVSVPSYTPRCSDSASHGPRSHDAGTITDPALSGSDPDLDPNPNRDLDLHPDLDPIWIVIQILFLLIK